MIYIPCKNRAIHLTHILNCCIVLLLFTTYAKASPGTTVLRMNFESSNFRSLKITKGTPCDLALHVQKPIYAAELSGEWGKAASHKLTECLWDDFIHLFQVSGVFKSVVRAGDTQRGVQAKIYCIDSLYTVASTPVSD